MRLIAEWDSAVMVKSCAFFSPKKIVTVILYLGLRILKAADCDLTSKAVSKAGDRPQSSEFIWKGWGRHAMQGVFVNGHVTSVVSNFL